jgi:hypothetical protein
MSSLDSVSHSLKALDEMPALPSLFGDTWSPRGASASIIQPAVGASRMAQMDPSLLKRHRAFDSI